LISISLPTERVSLAISEQVCKVYSKLDEVNFQWCNGLVLYTINDVAGMYGLYELSIYGLQ